MEYLPTQVNSEAPGSDAEAEVWTAIKRAFETDDEGVAYYKFPVVDSRDNEFDRELDFLLLHREFGLIVIECKGYKISHIDQIDGQVWSLSGTQQSQSRPFTQARDQGFQIRSYFNRERALTDEQGRCSIPLNVFVALPNISRREWEAQGFADLPSTPRTLTQDDLTPGRLRKQLFEAPTMEPLTADQYRAARSVLGGGPVLGTTGAAAPPDPTTKGEIYATVQEELPKLDQKQEEVGIQIPPGPQQVRGIAGSGKTVLMAMKAARMHTKYPEWDIAVTFHTKSLYQHIRGLITRFCRHFSEDDPNWNKLRVLHGWGGRTVLDGMYYVLAEATKGVRFRTARNAGDRFGRKSPPRLLDECCAELREQGDIPAMFDAILIDEAQDFYPNFYKMCRDALRDPQRLIWAYDEAQSLENLSAPSPTNIFGKDEAGNPVVDLRGSYPGGIQKSTIMRRSYRAPRAVLMTAHALGMGLKRSDGVVQTITTQDGWENIGYKIVTGDFRKPGTEVQIRRPDENSPHPLQDEAAARPFVDHQSFDSRHTEMAHVATSIREDVNEDDIDPEDIMIILLGQRTEKRAERVARRLDQQLPSDIETNLVWQGDGDVFKQAGKITVTRINRAKGNEAPVVYLTGIEYVDKTSSRDSLVQRRNKAFVGITRSRAWCTITGVDQGQPVFDELPAILEEVTEGDGSLSFSAPDATSLENELERETTRTELDDFGDFSIPDSLQRPSTEFR